ncbi:hypothetical protein SAMN05444851_0074 [Aliiroseovarius sediminilitoris]|uniref:Lipoprotein n=1 Tax=Aliiroseovarius sediminilitoris TaxID=1173584 RepID=A0A1I0MKA1_9RHOB|nr:hypothetical protein [Aliiroseovarius sediminilitoris]SEV88280.1 hypothetical protein SAMN05444851_0074 [Aliiroseovarius sediminilitoris]
MKPIRTCAAFLVTGLVVAACDSPSPQFMSADTSVKKATVDGSTFSVHRRENWVEVYRTSFEALPRIPVILARAKTAIEQATGCKVVEGSLSGDQAIQRAEIDCG